MANVETVEHGNGDVSIGVTIGGAFVPFASVTKARIGQLQERAADLRERSKSDDPEEKARVATAIAGLPIAGGAGGSGSDDGVNATEGARELASETGVDLASVTGTGSGGKVTKEDVQKAASAGDTSGEGGSD